MAGLWCKDLPFVTVERSRVPKAFTLIYPYYDNPDFLARQIHGWHALPASLRNHVRLIVVDDASPTMPAASVVAKHPHPFPSTRVFRIHQDVRWNWLAARNIGAHEAPEGWLLLTDMDHVVPPETFDALIHGVHDSRIAYAFLRREHTGMPANPHSASFWMTRALFWKVGGYDERCAGFYGTDGLYRRRLAERARMAVLRESLVRHEYQGDASTTRYKRKQPQDAGLRKLIATFPKGSPPVTLSFAYHEEQPC